MRTRLTYTCLVLRFVLEQKRTSGNGVVDLGPLYAPPGIDGRVVRRVVGWLCRLGAVRPCGADRYYVLLAYGVSYAET